MTLVGDPRPPYTVCIMLSGQTTRTRESTTARTRAIGEVRRAVQKTKLLIIDDRETVRQALEDRLSHAPEIELVGAAGTSDDGVQAVRDLKPDVVLLEIKMTDGMGLDTLQRVRQAAPCADVIVLTSYMDEAERLACFQAGASSYVLKDINSQRLIRAIESVRLNHAHA
jgi:DNA-binding NarL/FixJ family response regulator